MDVLRMLQAYKAPSPLSVNTLVPICYLYFTQGASRKYILMLVITTVMCTTHCNALGQGTIELI